MKKIILIAFVFSVLLIVTGCGYFQDASDTVFEETKASTLLKKYEWFKNASAELDKKQADIQIYEVKMREIEKTYASTPRTDWDRTDKETYNQWAQELAGIKASYNSLAAEYNAQMAKINWRFTNVGGLPEGADKPLPREYKPYVSQ